MTEATYLTIPTTPPTLIPLGISAEDFELLGASIELWKPRIAPLSTPGLVPPTAEEIDAWAVGIVDTLKAGSAGQNSKFPLPELGESPQADESAQD